MEMDAWMHGCMDAWHARRVFRIEIEIYTQLTPSLLSFRASTHTRYFYIPVFEVAFSCLSSDGVKDPEAGGRRRGHRGRTGHNHLSPREQHQTQNVDINIVNIVIMR